MSTTTAPERLLTAEEFLALPDESSLSGPPSGAARRDNAEGQRLGR